MQHTARILHVNKTKVLVLKHVGQEFLNTLDGYQLNACSQGTRIMAAVSAVHFENAVSGKIALHSRYANAEGGVPKRFSSNLIFLPSREQDQIISTHTIVTSIV